MSDRDRADITMEELQLVVFELASEAHGVDINTVREIIRLSELTRVPGTPAFVRGVISLRGQIVAIVDMRKRFALPEIEPSPEQRIVIVESFDQAVGILVDAVTGVHTVAGTEEGVSPIASSAAPEYVVGVARLNERMVVVLNVEHVLGPVAQRTWPELAA